MDAQPAAARSRFRLPPLVQHLIKFALGAAAIWALIHSGALEPALVLHALREHPVLVLGALGSYLFLVIVPAFGRWYLLIRLAGLNPAPRRVFSLHMIGIFFNSLIPGGTGGDLIKGFYLFRENDANNRALALTTIAMDRFVGLYALLSVAMFMTAVNLPLWRDSAALRANSVFYACVWGGYTCAVALFFSPLSGPILRHPNLARLPGGGFVASLAASLLAYKRRPLALLLPLSLGILVDYGLILLYYYSARAVGMELPLAVHGFVVPTLTMINGIPVSPAGIGVGEAAGKVIYGHLGVTSGGGEMMVLVHLVIVAVSLAASPFYLLYRGKSRPG